MLTPGASLSVPIYTSMSGLASTPVKRPPAERRHAVRGEHAEHVVDLLHEVELLELVHRQPRDDARADADDDRADAVDVTGGRRDRDEAGDHAVDGAENRRLAVGHLVHQRPDQQRDGGRGVGVEHGRAGVGIGEVRDRRR